MNQTKPMFIFIILYQFEMTAMLDSLYEFLGKNIGSLLHFII